MNFSIIDIAFSIIVFLFAISVHESAHAWSAYHFGDDTASLLGRISLNPVRHIDPVGTILMPAIAALSHVPLLGWAKPTPVNTLRLRNPVRDHVLIAAAGPISNFLIAIVAVILLIILQKLYPGVGFALERGIPAGTGLGASIAPPLFLLFYLSMQINVVLAVFNLFPIPPLDGGHILEGLLPERMRAPFASVSQYGIFILFALLWMGNLTSRIFSPFLNFFHSLAFA